jgi:hypothetical protein
MLSRWGHHQGCIRQCHPHARSTACTRRRHFEALLPFFNHPNYIRIERKPVFAIYKLRDVPADVKVPMLALWRHMAIDNGLRGLHIIAVCGYPILAILRKTSISEKKWCLARSFVAGQGWYLGSDEPLADGLM